MGLGKAPLNAKSNETIQRYRCAEYGHRFSEHVVLNTVKDNKTPNRISASGAKNLVPTENKNLCGDGKNTNS
jgi:hypothetical protein